MKKIINTIAVLMLPLVFASCEKELMTYDSESSIYFSDAVKDLGNTNSSDITFTFAKGQDSIKSIIVGVTGTAVNWDREYKVSVNPGSTAKAGVHFDALPEKLVIKKNALRDTIKLRIKRTPDMLTNNFSIVLDLNPNENFNTNLMEKTQGPNKISCLQYSVTVSDQIKKPQYWIEFFLGNFTRKKMFKMVEVLNVSPEIFTKPTMSPTEMSLYTRVMNRYFLEQKAAGNTILEDDNTEMTMGPYAQYL
ncbi:DUF4843 domain-containing protein [Solitalea longa]|nr:DUF4843 domain-containing protein [Solitalea longa]